MNDPLMRNQCGCMNGESNSKTVNPNKLINLIEPTNSLASSLSLRKTKIYMNELVNAFHVDDNATLEIATHDNSNKQSFISISSIDKNHPTIDYVKQSRTWLSRCQDLLHRPHHLFKVVDFHPQELQFVGYFDHHNGVVKQLYFTQGTNEQFNFHALPYNKYIDDKQEDLVGKFNTAGTEIALKRSNPSLSGLNQLYRYNKGDLYKSALYDVIDKHFSDLCYAPDDQSIVLACGNVIQLVDLSSGRQEQIPMDISIKKLAFINNSNNMLVMASQHSLFFYNLQTRTKTRLFDLNMICSRINISSNGKIIALHLKVPRKTEPKNLGETIKEKTNAALMRLRGKNFKEMIYIVSNLEQQKSPLLTLLKSEKWCDVAMVNQ